MNKWQLPFSRQGNFHSSLPRSVVAWSNELYFHFQRSWSIRWMDKQRILDVWEIVSIPLGNILHFWFQERTLFDWSNYARQSEIWAPLFNHQPSNHHGGSDTMLILEVRHGWCWAENEIREKEGKRKYWRVFSILFWMYTGTYILGYKWHSHMQGVITTLHQKYPKLKISY